MRTRFQRAIVALFRDEGAITVEASGELDGHDVYLEGARHKGEWLKLTPVEEDICCQALIEMEQASYENEEFDS